MSVPLFLLVLGGSAVCIFNYQKQQSSVVTSTLYALRAHPVARAQLGDEIRFASAAFPWISGELDQLHGRIDIRYAVKGSKARGVMRFKSARKSRLGLFQTDVWELSLSDQLAPGGVRVYQLLNPDADAAGETAGGACVEPFPAEVQKKGV